VRLSAMVLRSGGDNNGEADLLHDSSHAACPDRSDTMYLNVLRPKDVPLGPPRFLKEDSMSLRTHDISGAQARTKHSLLYLTGQPDKEEVDGSRPKRHFVDRRRHPDMSLRTCDIEKAQPSAAEFKTSRQCNPLEPVYDLPSFRASAVTPPQQRFHEGEARDTLKFKGEWRTRMPERDYARNPNETRDIEFSQPNVRQRMKGLPPRENLRTVERAGERIISSKYCSTPRDTNPVDPLYNVDTRTTHPFRQSEGATLCAPRELGRIPGCTPRQLHKDNGEPQASLIRSDIAGAVSQRYKGCLPFSIYDPPEITPFAGHMQLDCSDIDGTQTGTRTR
jgi:hypothetical protein